MKKRGMTVLLPMLLILVMGFVGCDNGNNDTSAPDLFTKPGTYTAVTKGVFGDDIVTKVKTDSNSILTIDVWHSETTGYGERAITIIKDAILAKQSLDVDTVTGATFSSVAFIGGVESALIEAGGEMGRLLETRPTSQYEEEVADVVVVGGGGAGITAAIKLAQGGKKVILLEKMGTLGGNTLRSSAFNNAFGSKYAVGVDPKTQVTSALTTPYDWENGSLISTAISGANHNDAPFREIVYSNSRFYIDWAIDGGALLVNSWGPISGAGASQGTSYVVPDHSTPGPQLIKGLTKQMDMAGVDYRLKHAGTDLVKEGDRVTGVRVKVNPNLVAFEGDYTYTIKAEHIIIATGGFGANREYKAEIGIPEPFATQRGTTNNPGNQGDGHKMAKKAGAELIRMADHWNVTFASSNPELAKILQPNTSANVNGTFLSLSSALYQGGIIVGSDGRRITAYPKDGSGIVGNDNSVGTLLSNHVTAYDRYWPDDNYAFLVIGHKAFSNLGNMRQYYNSGIVFRGNTPEELAQIINIDPSGLKNTIAGVRDSVDGTNNATTPQPAGSIDNMRWPAWWKDESGPYYAARVNPSTHGTFGGIWINANMQALDAGGKVIPGLFAVGVCSNTYSSQSSPSVHNNCAFGYAAANYILNGRGSDLWWND